MSYFHDASVQYNGGLYFFSAAEGEALEGGSHYWRGPGDPSSWLAVAIFQAARQRVGDAPEPVAIKLAAASLGITADKLEALIRWHENYMQFHDGDYDYHLLEREDTYPSDVVIPDVLAILTTTADRWHSLAQKVPALLLWRSPAPGEWSALECLQHIIAVEQLYQSRLTAFLAGKDFPAFDPHAGDGGESEPPHPTELANEFAALRVETLKRLAKVTRDDLKQEVRHAELGVVSLEEMVYTWATHDLCHTAQAERALMQPYLRASGPWQKFFAADRIGP